MMSSPLDLKAKIKDGLLFFRKISTNNEAEASMYKTIVNNTVEALKKVSTLNRFNAERVKNIYGIDIQGDGN